MNDATLQIFKALSDEIRLKILWAVSVAELSVAELVTVLGLPQSTVSRHLKPLRDTGLVEPRRDGTSVFYHRGQAFSDARFGNLMDDRLSSIPGATEVRSSVIQVLDCRKQRSRDFFDGIAGRYGSLTEPGGGWSALAAALAAGMSGRTVADLGAGEGQLALLLARFADKVYAVDQSPRMLRLVEEAADKAGLSDRVEAPAGDLENLPLADASVDAAFLSQALHHAAQPPRAIREAARILRPGGRLLILDLVRHEQEWVREQFADQWLGFDPAELRRWMEQAGLDVEGIHRIGGATPELPVLLASGLKI